MKHHFLWISLILLLVVSSCKSLQEKGNDQFLSGQYQYAISTYSQILAEDSLNKEANKVIAESYRLSNRIEKAGPYYEKLVVEDPSFENYYRLGLSLKAQDKHEKAKAAFEKAKEYTQDEVYASETQRQIEAIKLKDGIENYWPNHVLVNYKELNTTGADYAPVLSEDFIYFTSGREGSGLYAAMVLPTPNFLGRGQKDFEWIPKQSKHFRNSRTRKD